MPEWPPDFHVVVILYKLAEATSSFHSRRDPARMNDNRRNGCCENGPKMIILIGQVEGNEGVMPYVNIKVTKEGVTAEQKEKLIQGTTQLLYDVLGKKPQATYVVIEEVETDNWGVGGETITAMRRRGKK